MSRFPDQVTEADGICSLTVGRFHLEPRCGALLVKWRCCANYTTISLRQKSDLPVLLFQDSNLRNVSATTPASAQFCTEQLL